MNKLLYKCMPSGESANVKEMVNNEAFHYQELQHKKKLINTIWELSTAIQAQKKLKIKYGRLTNSEVKERIVHPVGILFSDFYFYLAAFIPEKGTKNPTIYRIDRLKEYKILDENFRVSYAGRFEEGEFRKRIQFMYGGELQTIRFRYFGESPEAIFDRFPTAELIEQNNGNYIFKAEVFGRGIKPWILSQTDRIEILAPDQLRNEIIDLIAKIKSIYDNNK